jgi:methenyltetrahydrofolate cyclohydrolase
MLIKMTCTDFIEELASDSPAPGGGSVSALAGSLGASLASMVASLTIGKEKFKDQEEKMQDALKKARELKDQLKYLIDEDTESFNRVMAAFRMPKSTDEEKKARSQAIQEAVKHAAQIPMQVAEASLEVLKLTQIMVDEGNPNALSDGGVGALMALAGIQGALFNVKINLGSIKDQEFIVEMEKKTESILNESSDLRDNIVNHVWVKLSAK